MADKRPRYGDGKALEPDDRSLWKEVEPGVFALARHVAGGVEFVDENGDAYGVKQIGNKPRVSSMSYLYDIAEGNVPDHDLFRGIGHNEDVGTAYETIWSPGALRYYLTAAERLQIVSDDADDDGSPGGAGARTVRIDGLDADWVEYSETVTLNGTTNVTTVNSFIRVYRMIVTSAGATGYNEGTITASDFADANVLEQMDPGENQSHSAAYSVPVGHTAYIVQFTAFEASNKGTFIGIWRRSFGGVWRLAREIVLINTGQVVPILIPGKFSEKTDVEMRARGILAGAIVTGSLEGWVELD